jgi:long-chain acyl-CoA synthetase
MSSLATLIRDVAARRPTKIAIACGDQSITYDDLAARSTRLAHALYQRGVRPGERIGVLAGNSVAFAELMLAAADLGAVLAPLSPALPDEAVKRAFALMRLGPVFADKPRAMHAGHKLSVALDAASEGLSLEKLIAEAPEDAKPLAFGSLGAAFILCATSGSTGEPKGVILTQRAKVERACAAIALYDVTESDVVLAATPLYHSLAQRLLFVALMQGATAVIMPRYTPSAWFECVARARVSFTIAVSTQLAQLARALEATPERGADCVSLRCVVSSSAPLSAADKRLILTALPGQLHECYGASEIAIATSLNLSKPNAKRDSVGFAAPGVEIRILDEAGAPAAIGDAGEIACRTPMMFAGYDRRPDLTAAALCDGFFKTGDLGRLDADGALAFLGRKKDMIIVGGMKVYPSDIESAVASVDGVAECAAFPLPDQTLGEIPAIAIVARTPGAVSTRAVRAACVRLLADFQQPQRVLFVNALPRNAMGKVMRSELPALAQTAIGAAA